MKKILAITTAAAMMITSTTSWTFRSCQSADNLTPPRQNSA